MNTDDSSSLKSLLKGCFMVKEIDAENASERTWVEIWLNRSCLPDYPLRTPPYAMLRLSKFRPSCSPEYASFKLRYATFLKEDIENGFDPNCDKVGPSIDIPSLSALNEFLESKNLDIEEFVDSARTDYPG